MHLNWERQFSTPATAPPLTKNADELLSNQTASRSDDFDKLLPHESAAIGATIREATFKLELENRPRPGKCKPGCPVNIPSGAKETASHLCESNYWRALRAESRPLSGGVRHSGRCKFVINGATRPFDTVNETLRGRIAGRLISENARKITQPLRRGALRLWRRVGDTQLQSPALFTTTFPPASVQSVGMASIMGASWAWGCAATLALAAPK